MNELALFAGAGGGLLATHHLLGWRCVGYVEMAEYPCKVLEARINDGLLSKAPIYQMHTRDFIRLGIAEKYRGVAQVITAGFPCQPFSDAGKKLAQQDERNGWPDTITIIRLVRPKYILLENVRGLISSGYFGTILGDLAQSGYDCRWDCIPAQAVGAPHQRDRLWITGWNVADSGGRYGGCVQRPNTSPEPLHSSQWEKGPSKANGSSKAVAHPQGVTQREPANKTNPVTTSGQARNEFGDGCEFLANSERKRYRPEIISKEISGQNPARPASRVSRSSWWATEPDVGRVVDGLAHRVDRLKALGNGQVSAVVAEVWRALNR